MSKPTGTALKLKTVRLKMQSPRETNLNSRVTHIAAAFVLAVVVGGCGGGGGSSGVRQDVSYPTLSNAVINSANSGVTSNYLQTGNQLAPGGGTVSGSINSPAQTVTLVVSNLGGETFSFVVNLTTMGASSPANTPLNSACNNCLRTPTTIVTASDGRSVSFSYLDPTSAGLTYSTLGLWSTPTSVVGNEVGAAFSIGVVTRQQDLPILNSSATYNGFMVGRYTDGSNTYAVGANAHADANFSLGPSSIVTFTTLNTHTALEGIGGLGVPAAQPLLNLSGTLNYNAGSNSLTTSTLTTTTGPGIVPLIGTATARYYGLPTGPDAAPAEIGGAFFVSNPTQRMNGSFALKQ